MDRSGPFPCHLLTDPLSAQSTPRGAFPHLNSFFEVYIYGILRKRLTSARFANQSPATPRVRLVQGRLPLTYPAPFPSRPRASRSRVDCRSLTLHLPAPARAGPDRHMSKYNQPTLHLSASARRPGGTPAGAAAPPCAPPVEAADWGNRGEGRLTLSRS